MMWQKGRNLFAVNQFLKVVYAKQRSMQLLRQPWSGQEPAGGLNLENQQKHNERKSIFCVKSESDRSYYLLFN
jgi:hypothetical protein